MIYRNSPPLAAQELWLHAAQNADCPITSITYPALAENYFLSVGDDANADFARGLLVRNRLNLAFQLLSDRTLLDFVDELQNAWVDRDDFVGAGHQPEDYESVADSFELAVKNARGLSDAHPELDAVLDLARSFQGASHNLKTLHDWTATAQAVLCAGGTGTAFGGAEKAAVLLLGARILWKEAIHHGSVLDLGKTLALFEGDPDAPRKRGMVHYATALVLLMTPGAPLDNGVRAAESLQNAIDCFRLSNRDFPTVLFKRLSETHERLGREHFQRDEMAAAAFHFGEARSLEEGARGLPVARALVRKVRKKSAKPGVLAALKAWLNG